VSNITLRYCGGLPMPTFPTYCVCNEGLSNECAGLLNASQAASLTFLMLSSGRLTRSMTTLSGELACTIVVSSRHAVVKSHARVHTCRACSNLQAAAKAMNTTLRILHNINHCVCTLSLTQHELLATTIRDAASTILKILSVAVSHRVGFWGQP
jgi:hypothetical protein